MSTAPAAGVNRSFALLAAAPVLAGSGWTLLGELGARGKIVPVSPQRFVAPSTADAPRAADLAFGNRGLRVTVIGAAGEDVTVTLVGPAPARDASPLDGRIVEVSLTLGRAGRAEVRCAGAACEVQHAESETQGLSS